MAAITTRITAGTGATVKSAPLTNAEVDNNFIALNTDLSNAVYLTGSQTISGAKTFSNNLNVQGPSGGALLLAYNTTSSSSAAIAVRPKQNFTSFDGTKTISATMLNSGSLSFDGSVGQLFNITDSMSGTIFSVNDISGIPSIEVLDTGLVKIAQYNGNVVVGSGTNNGIHKLQVTGTQLISANSTTDALRITQIGTGDALRVEDEANPDSSPFVINAAGRVMVGTTTPVTYSGGLAPHFQVNGTDGATASIGIYRTGGSAPIVHAIASNGTPSVPTISAINNGLLRIRSAGYDGTSFIVASDILAEVDGTPGTGSMPGRLILSTTANGASSPTEALRINSSQNIGIGNGVTTTDSAFSVSKPITTGTGAYGIRNFTTVSSNTTGAYLAFSSHAYTAATSFTLGSYVHYEAQQLGFGAGSTVTNQFGFRVQSNLIGATNNYGFFSDIPSGTNRWNFFASGTADNYLGGPLKIGQTYYSNTALGVFWAPAAASVTGIYQDSTINSATTTSYVLNNTFPGTAAASFTLPTLVHYQAGQNTFGAGSAVTNQFGFRVLSNLTSAANNFGFYSDIASGSARWNFYANGTAPNFFAGNVIVAATTASTTTTTGALVVSGGVGIAGALNATTKSFIIDHPTKPGKLLKHGSLEGPEFGVYVRGRLDNNNMIVLPEYWTGLVDPATITVNLTPVGSHQNLYVYSIENNVVTVKNSNMLNKVIDCFYTVFAERCDVEKLQVEV
jgi:hypothetical protein